MSMPRLYDPTKEDLYEVKGDPRTGMASTTNLDNAAEAKIEVRYSGQYNDHGAIAMLMQCEVYRAGESVLVHIICPKCKNANSIKSERKALEWDPRNGVLSVEPYTCNWEMNTERDNKSAHKSILVGSGNLCRARIAIDKNRARDA